MSITTTDETTSTTSTKPKQARSRRMRESLLQAGRTCIEKFGYEQMGIGDIALAAGCSTGAFYHHFSGKEDFYVALVSRVTEEAAIEVNEYFDRPDHENKPIDQFVYDTIALQVGLLRDNRELLVATLARSLSSRDAWLPVRAVGILLTERFWDHLSARNLIFRKPDNDRAFAIACQIVQGTLLQLITISRGPMTIDNDETIVELQDVMLTYLGLRR